MRRLLLAVLGLIVLPGCTCDLVLYKGSLNLDFSEPIAAPGLLEISVSEDLNAYCAVQLPLDEADSPMCEPLDSSEFDLTLFQFLTLTEDGLGVAGISYTEVSPETISLQILHDGVVLHDAEHTLDYEAVSEGHGGCKQTVAVGNLEVEISQ